MLTILLWKGIAKNASRIFNIRLAVVLALKPDLLANLLLYTVIILSLISAPALHRITISLIIARFWPLVLLLHVTASVMLANMLANMAMTNINGNH